MAGKPASEKYVSLNIRNNKDLYAVFTLKKHFLDVTQATELSNKFGFDTRRLVAAHNIVVISSAADSIHLTTIEEVCKGLINESLESFVIEVIESNPELLGGTEIDQVMGIVRFRVTNLRNRQWIESVLRDL